MNKRAYINPGSGAAIIGIIWPLIIAGLTAVFAFLIKYFWKPIKKNASKLLRRKGKEINNK